MHVPVIISALFETSLLYKYNHMYMQLHRYCYEMIITKSVILLKIYVIKKLGYVSARQGFFMCEPYKVKMSLHYMYIYTLAIFTHDKHHLPKVKRFYHMTPH